MAVIDTRDAEKYIATMVERTKRAVIRRVAYIGENAVNIARQIGKPTKEYTDQTGNLRSSIGYVIVSDGNVVQRGNLEQVKDGAEGVQSAISYLEQLAAETPKDTVLIIVAGMEYAKYLQQRGYDVLDSAEMYASRELPKQLAKFGIS